MRLSLLWKLETNDAALMSYSRQFHTASAAQHKAHDSIFVRDEHGSSFVCLLFVYWSFATTSSLIHFMGLVFHYW